MKMKNCEKIKFKEIFSIYLASPYIGCYRTSDQFDVFSQPGFSLLQCNEAETFHSESGAICLTDGEPYNEIFSENGMTVELCAQICVKYGFVYAGLNQKYFYFSLFRNHLNNKKFLFKILNLHKKEFIVHAAMLSNTLVRFCLDVMLLVLETQLNYVGIAINCIAFIEQV